MCVVTPEQYYLRGDGTKAVNKLSANFSQVSFLLHDRLVMKKKKKTFLYKPFFSFFIIQVLENSDFSYLSLKVKVKLKFFRH